MNFKQIYINETLKFDKFLIIFKIVKLDFSIKDFYIKFTFRS